MVVLDVDHPDILEFVETKAREEDKIRALRDAGFDMDLGGADIVSVQYQNANNSVRVSDEFMRAVESDGDHHLRARLDGSVIETVQARDLWKAIGKAAWACADPGVQYDDTINDWHTCPESGRITASNPCSEYVHLDNSSCNLASLNLMKFLRDDGTFDGERFVRGRRVRHHGDGHLHLLRRLPDRGDRRHHPRVPPARHRLRQPGRAAHGHRSRLRLRGWPGARRRHHLADDRHRLPAQRRAGGCCRRRTRATPATPPPTPGSCASTPRPTTRCVPSAPTTRACSRSPPSSGRRAAARGAQRLAQRAGLRARADRHDRPDDGLRHHRHRAGPRAGQGQEAGRRRQHADRQPHGAAGAHLARLRRRDR